MEKICLNCEKGFEAGLMLRRVYCSKPCRRAAYHHRHPHVAKQYQLNYRRNLAIFADSYKEECRRCGNADRRVLDFHHLRDKVKEVSVLAHTGCSKKRLLEEIEKCEVLCANCHRILHWEEEE